jgi:NADPH:quinone reductase
MKAFALEEWGKPGWVQELPVPEPIEGQVRVRVQAASLNPFDNAVVQGYVKDRMEHRFPLIPGLDASGTVDAVGPGVDEWAVGDEVFGAVGKSHLGEGTLAEFATMSAGTIARKPGSLEPAAAAAIPTAGVTALLMVDQIAPDEGQTVLAVGATGGVGSFFVQLASRRGVRVVAVSSSENADYARRLGASDVIDYAAGDLSDEVRSRFPDGIDGTGFMHGDSDEIAALTEQVRKGGRVASAVGGVDVDALSSRGIEGTNTYGRVTTESLDRLVEMLEAGEIVIPELRSVTLEDAGDALAAIATGHTRGKIVMTIG